ncbi:BON domain-containing protein [Lyngbya sp. CCY1209]|uniref:BON domain-containing protein n=1 Tax=Lyngbya sp. CCY1209 TaxID=2886103 RepID=UPI002D20C6E2|nr:BON domain-containing protein [Lyngbya sp. CCY1209]MEB3887282.1 BON domain-containing protein [Lyngbya sp. CCY1209]
MFPIPKIKTIKLLISGFLAVTVASVSAACDRRPRVGAEPKVMEETQQVESVAAIGEPEFTDSEITAAIKGEYALSNHLSGYDVNVETNQGIVILSGAVEDLLAQERATRIAETVKGVRSVVNRVIVEPSDRTDLEIAEDVKTALEEDPATEEWAIETAVNNGVVSLSGTVDSWQEKQLAARVVKDVKGVREVDNQILVTYDETRADSDIAADIRQALKWDARVDAALIDVSVANDQVILSGTVGSAFEKSIAVSDAYVVGVDSVLAETLDVEPWAEDESLRKEAIADITDPNLREAINDALRADPRVAAFNVDADVSNGIVTLSGIVDNLKAKRAAAQDAANTTGVLDVRNEITVVPLDPPTDGEIAENLRNRISRSPYIDAEDVNVSVDEGIVTLSGTVDSYSEKWRAGDLATLTLGVTGAINNLQIEGQQLSYDRPFYDWDALENGGDYSPAEKADAELKQDIADQMAWSPFIDRDDINISVNNGVATLTGTVDSRYEHTQVLEETYEAGVIGAIDKLDVEPRSAS